MPLLFAARSKGESGDLGYGIGDGLRVVGSSADMYLLVSLLRHVGGVGIPAARADTANRLVHASWPVAP